MAFGHGESECDDQVAHIHTYTRCTQYPCTLRMQILRNGKSHLRDVFVMYANGVPMLSISCPVSPGA
jgi:hypothetical protein